MDFIFIYIGLLVNAILLFKRNWLLQRHLFNYLFLINTILFISAYILQYFFAGISDSVLFLKIPVLSQMIFKAHLIIFRSLYKRDPKDTFWSNDLSLMKDGLFNFLFWVLGNFIPILIVFKVLK